METCGSNGREACGSDSAPGMPAVRVKPATGYGTLIACAIQLVVWACDPLVCTRPHTTIEGSVSMIPLTI